MLTGKTIASFWHNKDENNDKLPNIVVMSIRSFLDAGFIYELYSYQRFVNIPNGCLLKDANEILPRSEFFIHSCGSIAPFSDYFRIKLLLTHDVVWSDTDNVFIKDVYDKEIVAINQGGRIQNSFIYFGMGEKGNQIRNCLKNFFENPLKHQPYDSKRMRRMKVDGVIQKLKYDNINYRSLLGWNIAGSELYTSIFKYIGIMDESYDYYKFFNPFHFSIQEQLYTKDWTTINPKLFEHVGVFVLSFDLLRREPQILENYISNSFIGKLLKKYNLKLETLI